MYVVRWSRSNKRFVFEGGGNEYHALDAVGRALAVGEDNENLHLFMDTEVEMDGENATLRYEGPKPTPPAGAEYLGNCQFRICARRNMGDFRLKVEDGKGTWYVDGFDGVYNIEWHDQKSHLFHVGEAYLMDGRAFLVG